MGILQWWTAEVYNPLSGSCRTREEAAPTRNNPRGAARNPKENFPFLVRGCSFLEKGQGIPRTNFPVERREKFSLPIWNLGLEKSRGKENAMNKTKNWIATASLLLATMLLSGALVVSQVAPAFANDKQEAAQLVEKSRLTLDSFMNDNNMGAFRDLLPKAEGVLISPQLLKGAFIVGAAGGNAVFLARDKKNGQWSEPAFYTIGEASFGLQIGGEASEVILLAMTDRGVNALLGNSVKLGGDIGLAAGPVGMGAAAATANLSADILSFSRSKGLYGGVSLDGAVVAVRGALNDAYYGKKGVSPTDILVRHDVTNSQAMGLREDVAKSAARKSAAKEEIHPVAMSWKLHRG